jgi:hypothetical protein
VETRDHAGRDRTDIRQRESWVVSLAEPPRARLVAPLPDLSRMMRIWRVLAMMLIPWVSYLAGVADAHAQNFSLPAHFGEIANRRPSLIPQFDYGHPIEEVSLTFVVSVCLADLEYSSACREGSLLEAAKRLEQIYLDVYAMRRAAGSLRIWFPPRVERSEQLWFLREVEDRAIAATAKKLQNGADDSATPEMESQATEGGDAASDQQSAQQVRKWREDATLEARVGTNWAHDWSSRTHSYQTGMALHELVLLATKASEAIGAR